MFPKKTNTVQISKTIVFSLVDKARNFILGKNKQKNFPDAFGLQSKRETRRENFFVYFLPTKEKTIVLPIGTAFFGDI